MDGAPSSNRFSTIFTLCPVGLALTAEGGRVVEVNPALAATLGSEPEQIVGRRLLDFTHPDDRGTSSSLGQEVMSGDRPEVTLEKRYITTSGEIVPVRVTMISLDEPDGDAHKLVQVEDLSRQRASEDDLRREALEDPLTGLANRRALHRELTPLLGDGEPTTPAVAPGADDGPPREAPEDDQPSWAVLYIDLDNFKTINDEYGHRIGDAVLVAVGRRLAGVTRDADLIARVGGDEFVVVLRITDADEVTAARSRVRRSLARPLRIEGQALKLSASVGYALPRRDDSAIALLDRADAAMYEQKQRR
jgi:diguanylate cyclase (GGDEF)-like protein/PAS domain S-box-containing protein